MPLEGAGYASDFKTQLSRRTWPDRDGPLRRALYFKGQRSIEI
jgi:hypothetical protein